MNVYLVKTGSILPLGKQGENLARKIQFDISRWIGTFGPGTVQLLHQRSGDDAPYPVAMEQEGNLAVWTVTSADTAAAGTGRAELQYYVGDALAKSETWMTKVLPALGDASETPPEAQQGWVDQVLQAGAAAVEAAEKAENAAVRQPYPNVETGTWWVWDAESGAYADTGISYGTGAGGGVTDHDKLTGRDKTDQHPMNAITGLADALAGKQPTGAYLTEENDPTVPDWAKEEKKPSYTAAEVGADPSGTATSKVSAHNTGTDTHSDIRLLIQGLTERLNTLADSDDTTLDQLSEVVSYIKSNRTLIEAITTSKVSVADIIDNLDTNVSDKPLSASQGVALKAMIDAITIPTALPNPNALTFTGAVTGNYDGSAPLEVAIPSGGGGTGGGDDVFELIGEATSSGVSDVVGLTIPFDGSLYKNIIAYAYNLPAGNQKRIIIRKKKAWYDGSPLGWNGVKDTYLDSMTKMNNTWGFFGAAIDVGGKLFTLGAAEANSNAGHGYFRFWPQNGALPTLNLSNCKFISLDCNSNSETLPDGCSLIVWGVRK